MDEKNMNMPVRRPAAARWTPDMEFIGVRIPDKMLISSLINEARGKRTMAQLADACKVSASTLSRAVNGKITKPMTVELIQSITKNAEGAPPDFFEKLARANGLMPKEQYEERQKSGRVSQLEEKREKGTKAQNIIMTELLNRGIPVKRLNWREKELHSSYGQALPFDFVIETDLGKGAFIWRFYVIPYTLSDVLGEGRVPTGYYLRRVMQNIAGWFLTDAWEPNLLENDLMTFLFLDGSVYLSFEDTLILGPDVNTDFSFVTLDMEKEKVSFEIYMGRKDQKERELIFGRPVIEGSDDTEDEWAIRDDFELGLTDMEGK